MNTICAPKTYIQNSHNLQINTIILRKCQCKVSINLNYIAGFNPAFHLAQQTIEVNSAYIYIYRRTSNEDEHFMSNLFEHQFISIASQSNLTKFFMPLCSTYDTTTSQSDQNTPLNIIYDIEWNHHQTNKTQRKRDKK